MKHLPSYLICALAFTALPLAANAAEPIVVNVDNFDRAQTDYEFDGILKLAGGINKLHHNRTTTPIDKQNVNRMNRDTSFHDRHGVCLGRSAG